MVTFLPIPPGGHQVQFSDSLTEAELFIDGSASRTCLGAGAILKKSGAVIMETRWRVPSCSNDSTEAEILALRKALEQVNQEYPGLPFVVYTDSFQLIEHLNKKSERYSDLSICEQLLRQGGVTQLRNIDRKKNKQADAQARLAIGKL